MIKYFNVQFEFNHKKIEKIVEKFSRQNKGYCCFVDLNSLVYAHKNTDFRTILNNSTVNSCDGSYIAIIASKIHGVKLKEYIGPEFFQKFIFKEGKHLILGNTKKVFDKINQRVVSEGGNSENLKYFSLPFRPVQDFDYIEISTFINEYKPNYIWVSLGAPKQEQFMSALLPFINQGMLLGVGAAFNYFTGEIKKIPNWTKKLHVIWLYRILTEPKKQLRRCVNIFLALSQIIKLEKTKLKS